MARFRAPSFPPEPSIAARTNRHLAEMTLKSVPRRAGPSRPEDKEKEKGKSKAKDKGKGRARIPVKMTLAQKHKLRMAMKSRDAVPGPNTKRSNWSCVYVGNLNRSITQELLTKTFSQSGPVRCVIIRTVSGVPASSNSKLPVSPIDRMYASVEFSDARAANKALRLNGILLSGVKLAVCLVPADVPEIQEFVQQNVANKAEPSNRLTVQRAVRALKRVTVQRTQAIIEAGPSNAPQDAPPPRRSPRKAKAQPAVVEETPDVLKNPRLFGVSFARTLM